MQVERFQKIQLLGLILGTTVGAVISVVWPRLWGSNVILVGGFAGALIGVAIAVFERQRSRLLNGLVDRYRYFEIAVGALGIVCSRS